MVAARQLEPNPFSAADDLRKHVIRLMHSGEEPRGNILVLPQVFLEFLDYDHKMALFLNKLLYWTERTRNPDKWVYKTYHDWYQELGFKESVVRRLLYGDRRARTRKRTLADIGVEVKVKRAPNGSPTCHYRLNLAVFLDAVRVFMDHKQTSRFTSEPAPCAGSNPCSAQDEIAGSQVKEAAQCAERIDPQTPAQISPEENTAPSSPTVCDDDLQIFSPYQKRFGKFRPGLQESLRSEVLRLGIDGVGEVLERCAARGRSWSYVLKALANETGATRLSETAAAPRWGGLAAFDDAYAPEQQPNPETAPLPVSERLEMIWESTEHPFRTVRKIWEAARPQIEFQLGSSCYIWYHDLALVDFEPETATFVVVAHNGSARDVLQKRLYRTVQRILSDVAGSRADIQFLVKEEVGALGTEATRC